MGSTAPVAGRGARCVFRGLDRLASTASEGCVSPPFRHLLRPRACSFLHAKKRQPLIRPAERYRHPEFRRVSQQPTP